MKHSIRIWGCICCVLCLLLGNVAVFAGSGVPEFEYTLNKEKTEATITQVNSLEKTIEIPAEIDGYPVVAVGGRLFAGNYLYTTQKVIFPASVTSIDPGFQWTLRTLKTIEVAAENPSYTTENGILYNKDKTVLIRVPRGTIGDTFTVPSFVKELGPYALDNCNFTNVVLPEGLQKIDKCALRYLPVIHLSIPDSVTEFGEGALSFNFYLQTVKLPAGLTSITKDLLSDCGALTELNIPDSVTSLEAGAFKSCSKLTKVVLSNNIVDLPEGVFSYCFKLADVTFGENLQSIGKDAFTHCSLAELRLPAGLKTIGKHAFSNNKQLKTLDIPQGVTKIDEGAFVECEGLETAVLPEGITSLGPSLFFGCTSLNNVSLPADMTSLPNGMFSGCTNLEQISLPTGITAIGKYAFENCANLSSIELPQGITEIADNTFRGCALLEHIEIPEGVTTIGNMAFNFCWGLKSVTLPETLTEIKSWAFEQNRSLQSITIPANVSAIGTLAFYYCPNLSSIYFEGNAPTINGLPFSSVASDFTVYHLETASGFDQDPWTKCNVALWEGNTPEIPEPAATATAVSSRFDTSATGKLMIWLDINITAGELPLDTLIGAAKVTLNGQNTRYPVPLKQNGYTTVGYNVEQYRGANLEIQVTYLGCETFAASSSDVLSVPIPLKPDGSGGGNSDGKPPEPNFVGGGEVNPPEPTETPVTPDVTAPPATTETPVTPDVTAPPATTETPVTPDVTAPPATTETPVAPGVTESPATTETPATPGSSPAVTSTPSSGGGGGGGGGAHRAPTPTPKATASPAPSSAPLPENGQAAMTYEFTPEQLKTATSGTDITLKAPLADSSKSVSLAIPAAAFDAKESGATLRVESPVVSLAMDDRAMQQVNEHGAQTVTLQANAVEPTALPQALQANSGGRPALDLTLQAGEKTVSDFGSGSVQVSIPYTLKDGEDPNNLVIYYVAPDGTAKLVRECTYQDGMVTFMTRHFSTYAIGYNPHDFVDTTEHWAISSIQFVSARNMFNGVTDTVFAPNEAITRGMFVTVLGRMADAAPTQAAGFADVSPAAYYADYVAWAAEQGIVKGRSAELFAPEDAVTREELAVILSSYLQDDGILDSGRTQEFADQDVVSTWAQDSLSSLTQAGILTPDAQGNIHPRDGVTRAELAVILERVIRLSL